jgi:hypothetical protein
MLALHVLTIRPNGFSNYGEVMVIPLHRQRREKSENVDAKVRAKKTCSVTVPMMSHARGVADWAVVWH